MSNTDRYVHVSLIGIELNDQVEHEKNLERLSQIQAPAVIWLSGHGGITVYAWQILNLLEYRLSAGIPDVLVAAYELCSAAADIFILYRGVRHVTPNTRFMLHASKGHLEFYFRNGHNIPRAGEACGRHDSEDEDRVARILRLTPREKSIVANAELWLPGYDVADRINASGSALLPVTKGIYVRGE